MNNRIKELIALAHETRKTPMLQEEYLVFNAEKLAELIIKECLQFVKPDSSCSAEASMILEVTATQIKKHFGVE